MSVPTYSTGRIIAIALAIKWREFIARRPRANNKVEIKGIPS